MTRGGMHILRLPSLAYVEELGRKIIRLGFRQFFPLPTQRYENLF
jgi:hypothetical protein